MASRPVKPDCDQKVKGLNPRGEIKQQKTYLCSTKLELLYGQQKTAVLAGNKLASNRVFAPLNSDK